MGTAVNKVKPETVRQLESLQPGKKISYYRGNQLMDLSRCESKGSNDTGAPLYRAILQQVFGTANRLAAAGMVKLSEYKTPSVPGKPQNDPVIEYVATAL